MSSLPVFGFAAIAGATLLSEDLTTIGVGVAIREGTFPLAQALLACAAGIYLGDVGLWAAGAFGRYSRAPDAEEEGKGHTAN